MTKQKPEPEPEPLPPMRDITDNAAAIHVAGKLFDILAYGHGRQAGIGSDRTVALMGTIRGIIGSRLSPAFWAGWQEAIEFAVQVTKAGMARLERAGEMGYDPRDPVDAEICFQYTMIHDLGMDPVRVMRGDFRAEIDAHFERIRLNLKEADEVRPPDWAKQYMETGVWDPAWGLT
jgi:hypothetical protein